MLLDEEDVVLLEEGVDEEVDVEEVEVVVEVVVSEGLGVEEDFEEDVEESLDGEAGVKEVGEETGVGLDDFDLSDEDCVSEGVGEGVGLGVKERLLEDWALR